LIDARDFRVLRDCFHRRGGRPRRVEEPSALRSASCRLQRSFPDRHSHFAPIRPLPPRRRRRRPPTARIGPRGAARGRRETGGSTRAGTARPARARGPRAGA
jgi:hypothetical protein